MILPTRSSLLEDVQGLLVRTYRIRSDLGGVGRFVIGDRGYHCFYHEVRTATVPSSGEEPRAKTLIRETEEGVRACIYYPDELIRCLEEHPPQRGLREANIDAFATLVEELDHLLCIADRAAQGRPLTLFELELHANVSKHLVLSRFLAGTGRAGLGSRKRRWLRHHLFGEGAYCDEDEEARRRYRDASRWGVRFLDALERQTARDRINTLRHFHHTHASGKLDLIQRIAA